MIAFGVLLLMVGSCLGGGAMGLRLLGVLDSLGPVERPAWSFALGFGLLGWLTFCLALIGHLETPVLATACAAMLPGLAWLRPSCRFEAPPPAILLAVLVLVLAAGVVQALAPPADADSLAYHFAAPKAMLAAGHLTFSPRALDGAAPLLPQMTYLVALALGGERALTLWCMASGWAAGALVYGCGRRFLPSGWALAVALLFLTVPAMVYGAGTGQVEARIAMFVCVAAFAIAKAQSSGARLGWVMLAGLMAGFYMASKYPGLLFATAAGLVVLGVAGRQRWLVWGLTFALAAMLAGGQWYAWNWWNTGDPVFPMLYGLVPYHAGVPWNDAQNAYMKEVFEGREWILPRNLYQLLAYPIQATLAPHPVFEAGRVGFGPLPLLLLPFAVLGMWIARRRLWASKLAPVGLICLIGYALWFFLGPSQRVRHLLPLLPLLLICLGVAAQRGAEAMGLRAPLMAAMAACLVLQMGGLGVFSLKFASHLASGEDRDSFLARNVGGFAPVPWINAHLGRQDRVLVAERQYNYLLEPATFYAHPQLQAMIEIRPDSADPTLFRHQLGAAGITHLLTVSPEGLADPGQQSGLAGLVEALKAKNCLGIIQHFVTERIDSRTLPGWARHTQGMDLYAVTPGSCVLP